MAGSFPVARRGYERASVDERVHSLETELRETASALELARRDEQALLDRIAAQEAEVAALTAQIAETALPSYAGLGERASSMLKIAEKQATEITSAAAHEAEVLRRQTEKDASKLRAEAAAEAERLVRDQRVQIEQLRVAAIDDVEARRAQIEAQAEELLGHANRETAQLRSVAEQEVAALRAGAQHEAEQTRALAEREIAETRGALAIEQERLSREAAEAHEVAIREIERMRGEAAARIAAEERHAIESIDHDTRLRDEAREEADRIVLRGKQSAEQIVEAAHRQAGQAELHGRDEARRILESARKDAKAFRVRRDAIIDTLAELRDLISGVGSEVVSLDSDLTDGDPDGVPQQSDEPDSARPGPSQGIRHETADEPTAGVSVN